jgi:ribonuclease Z
MPLHWEILGRDSGDNALLVTVDTGQHISKLLFDCGQGCLDHWTLSDFQSVDHLCFSHLHMDHVAGFDSYFRSNFQRHPQINYIWGPPQTAEIMHHRFRSFIWNLHDTMQGTWEVTDIAKTAVQTTRYELQEAFAHAHAQPVTPREQVLFSGPGYHVRTITLDHKTPSIGYLVKEEDRVNIDPSAMLARGLKPGPWLKELKAGGGDAALREALLQVTPGKSVAYLTDFLLDAPAKAQLLTWLAGVDTLVCESQYHHDDLDLALRHHHLTHRLAAELARDAQVGELALFHFSSRYQRPVWRNMLAEAQQIFPNTRVAPHWQW